MYLRGKLFFGRAGKGRLRPHFFFQAILVIKKSVVVDPGRAGHLLDYQFAFLRIPYQTLNLPMTPSAINR